MECTSGRTLGTEKMCRINKLDEISLNKDKIQKMSNNALELTKKDYENCKVDKKDEFIYYDMNEDKLGGKYLC